jgi:hypothetical protein
LIFVWLRELVKVVLVGFLLRTTASVTDGPPGFIVRRSQSAWASISGALAEAEKQLESLVDAGELAGRYLSEEAPDATLVDRSTMIDKRVRCFREAARSCGQRRIQRAHTRGTGHWHYRY